MISNVRNMPAFDSPLEPIYSPILWGGMSLALAQAPVAHKLNAITNIDMKYSKIIKL
jgi:hypothetical protein